MAFHGITRSYIGLVLHNFIVDILYENETFLMDAASKIVFTNSFHFRFRSFIKPQDETDVHQCLCYCNNTNNDEIFAFKTNVSTLFLENVKK